ncbi:hypothetical protein F5984_25315 [Rudanella paleaurantiibacter]|uniref:Uncharacterized protein n=1 Tax=Rudanella paleaurantiibacter TaxID=2614655 RepID=A0A7J5TS32_9BACT|nr:hypothetical protein [Rudanella paleaurantiibacter]KAB7725980.1 hypothetical protein F5984_25315 [Rudanella paleaurantiibacter]
MKTTFDINANELDEQFFERFRYFFAGRQVRITVEEATLSQPAPTLPDQRQWFAEMEDLQKAYPPQKIPLEVEINTLSNSLYGRAIR